MISYFKCVNFTITIFSILFIKIGCSELVVRPSERIKTVTSYFVEGSIYASDMITHLEVNDCVNLCKAKKNCKFINFYNQVNICYLVGVIGNVQVQKENYLETAPGFIFGAKEEWDMEEFAVCDECNNYGICNKDGGDPSLQKCLESGCSPPVGLKYSIILGNMYTIGKRIRRKCVKGYRTFEKDQATCLSDGTWSQVYTDCQPDALFEEDMYDVDGTLYKFSNNIHRNWTDATTYCTDLRGNLAKIESQREQDALEDIIKDKYNQSCYWIGARRIHGVLEWWDGENLENGYQNMYPGEPDSVGDCVDLLIKFAYMWNDAPCDAICNFICKFI